MAAMTDERRKLVIDRNWAYHLDAQPEHGPHTTRMVREADLALRAYDAEHPEEVEG